MRAFDNPFWNDPVDPRRLTRAVDDLNEDPDERPSGRVRSRLSKLDRRQRIAASIGAYQVTTHVEGAIVAVDSVSKRAVPVIWAPGKRLLVLRAAVPEETAAKLEQEFRATVVGVPPGQDLVAALEARFGPEAQAG